MGRYSQVIGCRSQWCAATSSGGELNTNDPVAAFAGCEKYLAVVAQTNAVGFFSDFVGCRHGAARKLNDTHLPRCNIIHIKPFIVGSEHHMFRATTNPQVALDEPVR